MEASLGTYRLQGVCHDKVLPVIIHLIQAYAPINVKLQGGGGRA